jgi:hypothetical protein
MDTAPTAFQAVIFFDRGWWVAQCLEVDICVASRKKNDLPKKIARQLRGQAVLDISRGKRPFETFPKSPEKFWRMYSEAQQVSVAELKESWFSRLLNAVRGIPELRAKLTLATV